MKAVVLLAALTDKKQYVVVQRVPRLTQHSRTDITLASG